MKLLLTPAMILSDEQRDILSREHELLMIDDERIPLDVDRLPFRADEVEGIVCNFFFLSNPLDVLPSLRFIQLTSAGWDRVPLEEVRQRRIAIYNVGNAYAAPMAEWAVCKLLEMCKRSAAFYQHQRDCLWQKERDVLELSGMRAAIIGFGNVGRAIAQRLKPFGVTICAVDVCEITSELADERMAVADLHQAIASADVVFLTVPLTEETHHLMDEKAFHAMRSEAMLINVSRGAVVDEQALMRHLHGGFLRGVALDVFEKEPLPPDHPLWTMERVHVTPHNSFVSTQNREKLFQRLQENLGRFKRELE